jgi:hypothetical protein
MFLTTKNSLKERIEYFWEEEGNKRRWVREMRDYWKAEYNQSILHICMKMS